MPAPISAELSDRLLFLTSAVASSLLIYADARPSRVELGAVLLVSAAGIWWPGTAGSA
jgi:hypothetical protein